MRYIFLVIPFRDDFFYGFFKIMKWKIKPSQLILLSFAAIILIGTFLLMLPVCSVGKPIGFVEAFFTATSATCVTGLSVLDIGSRLSLSGQLVVLALIQTGGLGIMTFSTFFIYLLSHRLSIRNREVVLQSLSQHPMKDMASLLRSVFGVTVFIELIGSLFLFNVFARDHATGRAAYLAVFHAVSAFCNAGFSLFPDSLIRYHDDAILNVTISALLVTGGLGFIVIFDVYRTLRSRVKGRKAAFSFHTRIVLRTTFWLILAGALTFMCFEWFNALQPMTLKARLLVSLFQSVTPRTCGFNTVDYAHLTEGTLAFTMLLMFIGASPGSAGGGVKTTTFTLLLALVAAKFRDREDITLMERRIAPDIISRAVTIAVCSALLVVVATLLLLLFEVGQVPHSRSEGRLLDFLFEAMSAFGTVGLSTGITPLIKDPSRIILIVLMYAGRVGPLALAIELGGAVKKKAFRYPEEENILIG